MPNDLHAISRSPEFRLVDLRRAEQCLSLAHDLLRTAESLVRYQVGEESALGHNIGVLADQAKQAEGSVDYYTGEANKAVMESVTARVQAEAAE